MQNFYLKHRIMMKITMDNIEKMVVPSFENINAIIFHFSERPFLAISPDRGVEMPS
jgi:hypothetical protein